MDPNAKNTEDGETLAKQHAKSALGVCVVKA